MAYFLQDFESAQDANEWLLKDPDKYRVVGVCPGHRADSVLLLVEELAVEAPPLDRPATKPAA